MPWSGNMMQKSCRKTADLELLVDSDAKPGAARFTSKKARSSSRCAAAGHTPANAGDYHGWRRRHALVSAHERSRQAGCAARWQISHRRYPDQQLSELRAPLDLCAYAIQQHVAASAHPSQLQVRQFFAQLCGHSCCTTNARRLAMVSADCRCCATKHALLPRTAVRLLPHLKRRPTLPDG